jgi:DNA-directed RNA polymerase subunit beta
MAVLTERLQVSTGPATGHVRKNYGRIQEILPVPNLIQVQLRSFEWFKREGLRELFNEISPIEDFTGRNLRLEFIVPENPFDAPKYSEQECRERDMTYAAPLKVRARLTIKQTGEIKESQIYMGDFPLMTDQGTFIINGAERVVVSQLVRSPGVYFQAEEDPATGRLLFMAKLIPARGAWLEFETSNKDVITVKVDRKRKIPVTTFLRALGDTGTDEELLTWFAHVDDDPDHQYIRSTIGETVRRDPARTREEGLLELYRRLRPGDPATLDNAEKLLDALFFNPRRYDLGRVGRYKLNRKLGIDPSRTERTLTREDLIKIVERLIVLNKEQGRPDDIDHLGNRRVKTVGELIQQQFRVGLVRMERSIKERMTIQDPESATPAGLVNIRPVAAAIKEFFGGSQLSQFMDQTNPLAELTHKRRLSALGPGGLSRERAGFEVRDVHHSHYGRICPIETPEGPNIGLIGSLSTYARVNDYGFIETPYLRVAKTIKPEGDPARLVGRTVREDVYDPRTGEVIVARGEVIGEEAARRLAALGDIEIPVRPYVTDQVDYLTADEEERYVIAQANAVLNEVREFQETRVSVRHHANFLEEAPERIDYIDVSPKQTVSVAAALIPFLEHNDANRALMGSNMQRQAVPLIQPEAPLVATGMEAQAARDSGHVLVAKRAGTVVSATARQIVIETDDGERDVYTLRKFQRSNQGTCINQRPSVFVGDRVVEGQPIADSSSTDGGELALGQNVLVAFMFWEGGNYEDAILLSERLVQEDKFTSIHIEKYEVEARDTKLGPEEITRDIPNVGEEALRNLDEDGIVYVGANVGPGDILVGKITPKGETELTAEEKLLRAIFGEKAREVKDTSLRVPSGEGGKVVEVRRFSRDAGDELPPGVNQMVRVSIAVKRKISEGDKMAGRHGNKGVIAKILPVEDMPFLPDGTPVDIILSPLGAPSRMNIGQVLETHLGWAAAALGFKVVSPVFDSAKEDAIRQELIRAGLPADGKVILYDGRTGEPFDQPVVVGQIYMLKLLHLVEDKIHARSTGPYSLITQQPLGGKAQFGGQRFGEMEVWALEAYGAAHTLQELLTVKSDDVIGRVKTYEAIVKGEDILEPGVPESFKVLVKELQSLGIAVEVLNENEEEIQFVEDTGTESMPELGINLEGLESDRE